MNSATKIRVDFRGVLFGFRNLGDLELKFEDGLRKKVGK